MTKFLQRKYIFILLGVVLIHLYLLFKLKFTAWPEMLLWPYLTLRGLLPYRDIAIAHTPHLIIDLAIFYRIFGVGIEQLKIYTWLLIAFTDMLLFWVVGKLWNQKMAVITVAVFAFWQIFFDGNGMWFDLMLVPLSVITFFLVERQKYFWVGVFWVFMFFTKQTAVWFLIPIIFSIKNWREFILGILIATITCVFGIWMWGILPNFYQWAIHFGIFILPRSQGQIQLPDIKNLLVSLLPFVIFIPYVVKNKTKSLNLILWTLAGTAGAYPRFEFFHFQPALPFLAIVSGLQFTSINKKDKLMKTFIILYILGSIYLFANFFLRNWDEGTRFYEQDVVDISSYVKNNTHEGDRIFVMNWWDNIYALTNTIPATDPWVPQLAWYQDIPGVQDKEVKDIANSKPKLILLYDYSESGLASYKPQKVYDYVVANYELKEKVDGIEILIPKI